MKSELEMFKGFAKEDIETVINEGMLIMSNTTFLCTIIFTFEDKVFTAKKPCGKTLIETKRKALMMDFMVNSYTLA